MLLRCGKWIVALSLVLVIGGHWVALQSVAWVSMTVSFSKQDSFRTALQKTFDGRHPCKLCQLIKAEKSSEQKRDLEKAELKLEFLTVAGSCVLFPPEPVRLFHPQAEDSGGLTRVPPVPPPRLA